jgi:hypothetical protein
MKHLWLTLLLLSACSGARKSEWDNLDYTRVRQHYNENDSSYTPATSGCIDEDLYNCH